jgi:hypothetical protein
LGHNQLVLSFRAMNHPHTNAAAATITRLRRLDQFSAQAKSCDNLEESATGNVDNPSMDRDVVGEVAQFGNRPWRQKATPFFRTDSWERTLLRHGNNVVVVGCWNASADDKRTAITIHNRGMWLGDTLMLIGGL